MRDIHMLSLRPTTKVEEFLEPGKQRLARVHEMHQISHNSAFFRQGYDLVIII